jgi:hypothetical protein
MLFLDTFHFTMFALLTTSVKEKFMVPIQISHKESVYFTCSRSPLSREPLASQTISKVDNDSTSMGTFLSGIVSREGERMNKL